ncbi:MAG TPA: hypothetical protein VGI56_04585 [Galbitalea sp.]|jgi:uncharacterized membrane protein
MAHTLLIVLHATCATLAFGVGCALMVRLPTSVRSVRFWIYYAAVWVAMLLLISVVLVDWTDLILTNRIAFGVLCLLAIYLLWRTERSRQTLVRQDEDWRKKFAGHVGFVLISLFDGFCIVTAIDLHLPPVVTVIVAILGVAAGILVIRRVARRETRPTEPNSGIAAP